MATEKTKKAELTSIENAINGKISIDKLLENIHGPKNTNANTNINDIKNDNNNEKIDKKHNKEMLDNLIKVFKSIPCSFSQSSESRDCYTTSVEGMKAAKNKVEQLQLIILKHVIGHASIKTCQIIENLKNDIPINKYDPQESLDLLKTLTTLQQHITRNLRPDDRAFP